MSVKRRCSASGVTAAGAQGLPAWRVLQVLFMKEGELMATCKCVCAWCKEARVNKYSSHACMQIPKCSKTR